ncbi:MAG TPA: VOC family protein [Mycobacteriales bacterium]|jgi:hypothetical protein|nr:VOC family protein [Mycobacteriales bacterium]
MYTRIQVVFDAANPAKLAEFWGLALGYVEESPPPGFDTWEEFGRSIGMPEEQFGDQAAIVDPEGAGPRIYIQRVPEGKTAKNRVHLDIRVAEPGTSEDDVKQLVAEKVARLIDAGGSLVEHNADIRGKAAVMRDPEGNEFCVT